MALVRCDFFSEVLEVGTSMTVLLPEAGEGQIGVPTGAPTDQETAASRCSTCCTGSATTATAWLRYTSIERYAGPLGLAVVMPEVQRSFYADEAHGAGFWTFLSEELPSVVESFFRVSPRRDDTFVAGLSMGGYGALKWACATRTGSPPRRARRGARCRALWCGRARGALRPGLRRAGRPGGRPVRAARRRPTSTALPSLYVGCGTEDELFDGSVRFVDAAVADGVDVHVDFRPGEHEWGLWDAIIRDVLAWLPLAR